MKIGCTRCGANIVYVPSSGKCHCEHCGSDIPVNEFDNEKYEIVYDECTCDSCGAKLIVDESTVITTCAYCGSNHILRDRFKGEFKPTEIIPFSYDNKTLQLLMKKFLSKKVFAPESLRKNGRISEIKGVYIPFWVYVYDSNTTAHGRFFRVEHTDNGDRYVDKYFSADIPIRFRSPQDGSMKLDDDTMTSLEPFDFYRAVPYNPAYMIGFSADAGDESDTVLQKKAVARGINEIYQMICDEFRGYDLDGADIDMRFRMDERKCIMLPIWFATLSCDDGEYLYAINGQTGKIIGEVPMSYYKLGVAALIISALALLIEKSIFSVGLALIVGFLLLQILKNKYQNQQKVASNRIEVRGDADISELSKMAYEDLFGIYNGKMRMRATDENGANLEESVKLWKRLDFRKIAKLRRHK